MIRKTASGKYQLVSRKKDAQGHHKNLGTYATRAEAKERERQVQYFKHRRR